MYFYRALTPIAAITFDLSGGQMLWFTPTALLHAGDSLITGVAGVWNAGLLDK